MLSHLDPDRLSLGHAPALNHNHGQGNDTKVDFIYPTLEQELGSVPNKSYGLKGGSPRKIEGLLLKEESKDSGQETGKTDVSYKLIIQ